MNKITLLNSIPFFLRKSFVKDFAKYVCVSSSDNGKGKSFKCAPFLPSHHHKMTSSKTGTG